MSTTRQGRQGRMLTKQDIINGQQSRPPISKAVIRGLTNAGLSEVDAAFEGSELLMSVAPIRFITIGGMLAVSLLQNRNATKDIDFLLDPNVDAVEEYRNEVLDIIQSVGRKQGFNNDWMNDELKIFIHRSKRLSLFLESVDQGIVAYQGKNLVVYAGRLDFALERKIRRIDQRSNHRPRGLDLSDAVTLVHHIKGDGHPLSWQYIRDLDENELGIKVGDFGIQATATEYLRVHDTQGIVEMVWDETREGWKYETPGGEWTWV